MTRPLKTAAETWPYFGGPYVETGERRLHLVSPAAPGFWQFQVRGRHATPLQPAGPMDLADRPTVRGYAVADYVVTAGGAAIRLGIQPAEEPVLFAPMVTRRWHSGELIFDGWDVESGVEGALRRALAQREGLRAMRGVPPALRAAYAYAVLRRASDESGIAARPAEARGELDAIAHDGDPAAERLLHRLRDQRLAALLRPASPGLTRTGTVGWHPAPMRAPVLGPAGPAAAAGPIAVGDESWTGRAERLAPRLAEVLAATGAVLRQVRALEHGEVEVGFDFMGDRFASIVDAESLLVIDAGICLDGADRLLTLDSLPAVIREAISDQQLTVTAR